MNLITPLAPLTALFYLLHAGWLLHQLRRRAQINHRWLLLALLPALMHGFLLHQAIDAGTGQNLSFFNIVSMVSWLVVLLLLIPTDVLAAPLMLLALPVAAFGALVLFIGGDHVLLLNGQWWSLAHIFAALIAYSLLMVAAAQAVMLAVLEHRLRKNPGQISPLLPPLTLQEQWLFRLIHVGFILLSFAVIVAAFGLREQLASQPLHKSVFALLSWAVFGVLIIGRWKNGWRGRIAVRWTLSGFGLLAVSYVGTRLMVEFVGG